MRKETLIYPPTVFSYNWPDGDPRHGKVGREISYSLYHDAMKHRSVGDVIRSFASAPGTGYIDQKITRMDDTGVYGYVIEDNVRELTRADVE